jgi:hypothetical protein
MPPGSVSEMNPRNSEGTLIDQIHEQRIQNLEEGLNGCEVELGKVGERIGTMNTRLGTMEATISTGLKAVTDSIAPISAKLLEQEDAKKAKAAQEQLIKKYKTPIFALGAAVGAATLEAFMMWLFGA